MKKSEIVRNVNLSALAQCVGLSPEVIKRALVATPPTVEMVSIGKLRSVKDALKMYNNSKSLRRRELIACKAFELCRTIGEVTLMQRVLRDKRRVSFSVDKAFLEAAKRVVSILLTLSPNFFELHALWQQLDDEILTEVRGTIFSRMLHDIPKANKAAVVTFIQSEGHHNIILFQDSDQYKLLQAVAEHSDPKEAAVVLMSLGEYLQYDHARSSWPVQLLIQKAAQGFPAKRKAE